MGEFEFFLQVQTSLTLWILDPKSLAEEIISWKTLERSWDPSWLTVRWCVSKTICLVAWTRLVSWQKFSWWVSLSPTRGSPSLHFWWVNSSAGAVEPVASPPDGWCHCLLPVGGDGSLDAKGRGAVDGGSLAKGVDCGAVVSREAGGMLPMRSRKGYNNTLWPSMGQALKAAPQASRKDRWVALPFPVPHAQISECPLGVTVEEHGLKQCGSLLPLWL